MKAINISYFTEIELFQKMLCYVTLVQLVSLVIDTV